MLENYDNIMQFRFNFDTCPMHSPFRIVHFIHQNLSACALFCHNSLAKVNTQLLKYNYSDEMRHMQLLQYSPPPFFWCAVTHMFFKSTYIRPDLKVCTKEPSHHPIPTISVWGKWFILHFDSNTHRNKDCRFKKKNALVQRKRSNWTKSDKVNTQIPSKYFLSQICTLLS